MSDEDQKREITQLKTQKDKNKKGNDDDEASVIKNADGIGLKFFKKNCSFLAGCLSKIVERLLMAHGLDIESTNASIDWQRYLDLYCIFEAGKMDKTTLIRFWIKFFDIGMRGTVKKKEYLRLLEELVRGNTLNKASSTTKMFAKMFQKMMFNAGCLDPVTKDLKIPALSQAFEKEEIDIQLLCSALGRQ